MHIIHDLDNFEAPWESAIITLGVFDGMHKGHQALIRKLQKIHHRRNQPRILVTYHPHPDLVLGKKKAVEGTEIFTYKEKLSLLQKFNIDVAVFLSFTPELAAMSAHDYLKNILLDKLHAGHIIIGYDQSFGRGRRGNYDFLKRMSKRYNFRVDRIGAVRWGRKPVSSTTIRNLIRSGEIRAANRLLGHDFFLTGTVVRGFQRGASLGFPTANLEVTETKIIPAEGVYAAIAERGARKFRAMVNIGRNPTFGQEKCTIEAHLLNFNEQIYGEQIRLYFKKYLRAEKKFKNVEELIARLEKDRKKTMKIKLV